MISRAAAAFAISSLSLAAEAGTYGGRIVVPIDLPRKPGPTAAAIDDLKTYLSQITGKPFDVGTEPGGEAISLVLDDRSGTRDGKGILGSKDVEAFRIRADKRKLSITASDERGLANGIYFYLEALGVRWLLAGKNWTEVPNRSDITLKMDRVVAPAFKSRGFAATGGPYSWKWGHSYQGSETLIPAFKDWTRRLRYAYEPFIGKAVGEAFIADRSILPILTAHPDYLAIIDGHTSPLYITNGLGKRVLNVSAKVNAGNPEAVSLFCNWASKILRAKRRPGDAPAPRTISVEPSDGYGYGNNLDALPGTGSGSDQTFFIANQCAREVRTEFPGTSVISLAYAGHAEPPTFALEPNVIVQVTPYAFQPMPPEQFIAAWKKKARRLAIYDYWSLPDWEHDEPTFDYPDLAERLRYWRSSRIEGVHAESTYSSGAMGLSHYLAAHLLWDLDADEPTLVADWFDKAFGPAKAPMHRLLERWARSFRQTSAEMSATYKDLAEAARLAAGSPKITARVDDYIRYAHYLRLRLELANATVPDEKARKAVGIAEYLLDINDTFMVGTTRQVDLLTRTYPVVYKEFDAIKPDHVSPGWARVHELTHADVAALLADGVKAYPDAGFEPRRYSKELAFVRPQKAAAAARAPGAWSDVMPTIGGLDLIVSIPQGVDSLALRVSKMVDNEITVRDTDGKEIANAKIEKTSLPKPLTQMQDVKFALAPGRYKLQFRPQGGRATGYFSLQMPSNIPAIYTNFLSHKGGPSPRLYFYVPPGLRTLAIYYPYGDFNDVFHFKILDADGRPTKIDYRDNRRLLAVKVPPGQDGKIWSLKNSVSPDFPFEMLNAPQAFSLSPDLLMTSVDALPARETTQ